MGKYTEQDIMRMVEEEDVEFIRLQFTDIFGILKNVAITKSQLPKALRGECMFDGSSIEGFARVEESDMLLRNLCTSLKVSIVPFLTSEPIKLFILDSTVFNDFPIVSVF